MLACQAVRFFFFQVGNVRRHRSRPDALPAKKENKGRAGKEKEDREGKVA